MNRSNNIEPPARVRCAAEANAVDGEALRRAVSRAENAALVLVLVAFTLGGVYLFRHADDPVVEPPSDFGIGIGAPNPDPRYAPLVPLSDRAGPIGVNYVGYDETPLARNDGTQVSVDVILDRPVVGNLLLRVLVGADTRDRPNNLSCTTGDESPSSIAYAINRLSGTPSATCKASDYNPRVGVMFETAIGEGEIAQAGPDGVRLIKLKGHVRGLNGMGVRWSRTRAELQLPMVIQTGKEYDKGTDAKPYQGYPVISVRASFTAPSGLSRMQWSGTSPTDVRGDKAAWSYSVAGPLARIPPPNASGVRADLLARNGPYMFFAGTLLSLAAGAAIPLFQSLVRWIAAREWHRRRRDTSHTA